MSIYDLLKQRLKSETGENVVLSFAEIEIVLGRSLPKSAYTYRAWWANEDKPTHVQSRSWLSAGFHAKPNLTNRMVKFDRYAHAG